MLEHIGPASDRCPPIMRILFSGYSYFKRRNMDKLSVIIVAAGEGKRLGRETPKAFVPLGGKPLFAHSLLAFDSFPETGELFLVVAPSMTGKAIDSIGSMNCQHEVTIVAGGEHRWQSAESGVRACNPDSDWVLIHDAARPFITHEIIAALVEKKPAFRCVITAIPENDTIRRIDGDLCLETVDRSSLIRVGTPQLFHQQTLLKAFNRAPTLANPPTDEAMLMEHIGIPVGYAPGDPLNFKITTEKDLFLAEALIAQKK
ncbi:MAG: 2-C-methyl-D-erythritol 4-phosphate cytidylyltransferase [Chitinivibrionales bacterium]|nr:2-C-methyl-D-erythritol 4-phosphate cytidylyltransferase [Chitinivibrionales bacterium]